MTNPAETIFTSQTNPKRPDRWDAAAVLPEPRNNRPITLGHRLEAAAMTILFGLLKPLGLQRASNFLGKTLRFIGPKLPPIHKRGVQNLRLVYPEKPADELETILKNCWENLGRTVAEYPYLKDISAFGDTPCITIENAAALQKIIATDQQVIFVSAHLGNWETMPATLYQVGLRNAIVYRAANNPIVDGRIIKFRSQVLTRHQIPKGKTGGREIINALKDGLSLCMLVDQKLNSGISVPFMGHDAMTGPATARLALKYKLPVIPLSVRRTQGVNFIITMHDPIQFDPDKSDTTSLTLTINEALGTMIKAHPEQWLWFHNRWPKK